MKRGRLFDCGDAARGLVLACPAPGLMSAVSLTSLREEGEARVLHARPLLTNLGEEEKIPVRDQRVIAGGFARLGEER